MNRLKDLRLQKGLLQKDIAIHLGIDRTTYVKYESGSSEPPFSTLFKLAEYFDVTIDYLLGFSDIPSPIVSLTDSENELLSVFRTLNQSGVDYLLQTARMARENPQFSKESAQVTAI